MTHPEKMTEQQREAEANTYRTLNWMRNIQHEFIEIQHAFLVDTEEALLKYKDKLLQYYQLRLQHDKLKESID